MVEMVCGDNCSLEATFCSVPHEVVIKHGADDGKLAIVELGEEGGHVLREMSYAEVASRALSAVVEIRGYGLGTGDRVAMLADNCAEHIIVGLACAMAGFVFVPMNFESSKMDIREIVENCSPSILVLGRKGVCDRLYSECIAIVKERAIKLLELGPDPFSEKHSLVAKDFVDSDIDQDWAILYTSGTTSGKKKGAVRNQRSCILGYFGHLVKLPFDENDRFLAIYPMHGVSTFFFSFMTLYFGATCFIMPRKAAGNGTALYHALSTYSISFTTAGPSHFLSVINSVEARHEKSLKKVLLSGAMTSDHTNSRIKGFFQAADFFEGYGSTEAGLITFLGPKDVDGIGSVGRSLPGISKIQFFDPTTPHVQVAGTKDSPGEIVVRTNMMFSRYWANPDLTRQSSSMCGYFRTGDVGYQDKKGYLYLLGRLNDRVNLPDGVSFFPSEVEGILLSHVNVNQAFVFTKENNEQDVIIAAVIIQKKLSNVSGEELKYYCVDKLQKSLQPSVYHILGDANSLPKTSTGKVLRSKLGELFTK
mmetsp:Transcript_5197/g.7953  ORF Transcript_5197/g.7953 Transcript_5197/m.7953 type:complete len:534 (+) Transcript_5197:87-1688(+)